MANSKVVYFDQTLLDLTSDTVTPASLVKGTTAHNAAGQQITGTLEFITYYSGSDGPSTTLGSDGDLYFKI